MKRSAFAVLAVLILPLRSLAADVPLLDAIRRDDQSMVRDLLKKEQATNVRDETGATALMYAALYASPATLLLLLEGGADLNASNANGSTALMWAAGDPAKVRLLLDRGAAVDARTKDGTTAFLAAAQRGSAESMRLLLARGATPKATPAEVTSLLRADYALRDVPDRRRVLAEAGIELKDPAQLTTAGIAVLTDMRTVEKLLSLGAEPNLERSVGRLSMPVLADAAFDGQLETMRALLGRGADPNRAGKRGGITPLMMAAAGARPSEAAVRLLLEKGADIRARDERGRNALDWALTQGDTPVARLLRSAGASPAAPPPPPPAPVAQPRNATDAIEKAVARLQPIGPVFNERTNCISCHDQSLPAVAVKLASDRGIPVNRELASQPTKATLAVWGPTRERLLLGSCQNDAAFVENTTYGLFALAEEGVPSNPVTDAVALCLADLQHADGTWKVRDPRPPLGDPSPLSYAALAVRGLMTYAPPGRKAEVQSKIARTLEFVRKAAPGDTQDQAFKVLALKWAGAAAADVSREADRLRALQRTDGGWGQLPTMASDAYATGQALYALHVAGVSVTSGTYQKGTSYLLRTQLEDGSWFVRSRAFGFQPYFDAGFPHGTDQFISAAATSWAAIALSFTL
jgi:ankyrin repeat protein